MTPLDQRAADILATQVQLHRKSGADPQAILAAGLGGVELALAKWDASLGYTFDTWCAWWIRQAIGRLLEDAGPASRDAKPLCADDFVTAVSERYTAITPMANKVAKRHRRRLRELIDVGEKPLGVLTTWQLAFFDLFEERYPTQIAPWLAVRIRAEADHVNGSLGDDEQQDYSRFHVHAIDLPDDKGSDWELVIGFEGDDDELDIVAHFAFDGWVLGGISWTG